MKKDRSLTIKVPVLLLILTLFPFSVYAEVDSGYETANNISGICPTNADMQPDAWGFAACNCTSYVAYRLNLNNVRIDPNDQNSELFDNTWGSSKIHFGYAFEWSGGAAKAGVRKDQYPAVGSVAYWDTDKIAGTGHVAYVQHLFTTPVDGRLVGVGIMEYNWADCPAPKCSPDRKYRYRKLYPGRGVDYTKGSSWPSAFLHFEEKGRDATDTNVTCVSGFDERPNGANRGSFCWKHNGDNAKCENAFAYYYFDYQHCEKYTVSSSYCNAVGTNPGYTAKIGTGFPEPIDSTVKGTDFAVCGAPGSPAHGNSKWVSGRDQKRRAAFLRNMQRVLN